MQKVKFKKENQYFDEEKNLEKQLGKDEIKTIPDLKEKLDVNNNNINKSNKIKKKSKKKAKKTKGKNINIISKKDEIDKNKENEDIKYYLPVCKETGCEGHLKIGIDEVNFIVKGICDKDKNHQYNNLYFETFERFYLSEQNIQKCYNCSINLENKDKYECKECDKLFCSSCFLSDKHIIGNIKNLKLETKRCPKDKSELTYYCSVCKQKICAFCYEKDYGNNPHSEHKIKNLLEEMPSLNEINNLKEEILKKSKAIESLISSLNEWQEELNKKIERIKQNLRAEISILKKLFINFNQDLMEYTYYWNFRFFLKNIKDYNNEYFENFMKKKYFDEKSKIIFDMLSIKKQEIKEIEAYIKKLDNFGKYIIVENFTKEFLILYSSSDNEIKLISINDSNVVNKIDFDKSISSFNFSPDNKTIYVCWGNKYSIYIINYNPEDKTLKLNEKTICVIADVGDNYKKCIHLDDNYLLTAGSDSIYLWYRKDINSYQYYNVKEKVFNHNIYDICQVNDNYLIFSQREKLTFFSVGDFKNEIAIKNIDCIQKERTLILIKDFILVNCEKGIAIIYIKTKEMIQYVENLENFNSKKITKSFDDNIYILIPDTIFKYNLFENTLSLVEKIEIKSEIIDYDSSDSDLKNIPHRLNRKFLNDNYNIIANNNQIFLWDDYLYNVI